LSNLEYVVRKLCKTEYSNELILNTKSDILAYSILSGKPIENIVDFVPEEELNYSQLDDYKAIRVIVGKIKLDIENFNYII